MTEKLSVDLPDGIRVEVTPEVLIHLDRYRQKTCFRREAGGQLFARISRSSWRIVTATGPRKSDWRSRFGYRPDRKAEREEIDKLFASGLHFVGDWHTHPQAVPKASATDIESMNDTVNHSIHSLPGFLMLIVGTAAFPAGLWVSFHRRFRPPLVLTPLTVVASAAPLS